MSNREIPAGIRLGVVRGISYGLFGPPDPIAEPVRALGAGVIRCYLYWSQLEPEPGRYVWDVLDTLLAEFDGGEEIWITVSSASRWGTRRVTDFLPPSPALDLEVFGEFVRGLVARGRGRVTYWQCDNEPSVPILWAGTTEEYAAQLKVFAAAVRESDPAALVVLGGQPPEDTPGEVFHYLAEHSRDDFDVFDVHLYGDPYTIPDRIAAARALMAAHGYEKPVVAGEYNGPLVLQYPELFPKIGPIMQGFGGYISAPDDSWTVTTDNVDKPTPEHDAMVALYDRMPELPPHLQMFLADCPPEYEQLRHRQNAREIVMRNVLALASGVRRTLCWNLAPEAPGTDDRYAIMHLLFDKFKLMDYAEGRIAHRYPSGDALALTAEALHDAHEVKRYEVADRPELYVFEIARDRGPLIVAWSRTADESAPPVDYDHSWSAPDARARNAFGDPVPVRVANGRLTIGLSMTPVLVTR
ncbi:hypothetical protein VMT65_26245 [Nocardia sp. CDC153]|uniref:hypothetical protein n=1 Tax=Nocardia sp. CDC153 TaxID=3112167 RepID=UPI002DBBED15|nr:hypothetical protein [Nocardia sp. CDC153]MEC3956562.1 hypothetical protein [Nocardia sp. CDC153]